MTDLATDTCPKCGHPHNPKLCQGHVIKHPDTRAPIPARQCEKSPMKGQTKCRTHGGSTSQARNGAAVRLAEAEAGEVVRRAVFDVDAPPVKDATAAALRLAGQLSAMADVAGEALNSGHSLSREDRAFYLAVVGKLSPLLIEIERLGLGRADVALRREEFKLAAVALGRTFQFLELGLERQAAGLEFFRREVRAVIEEGEGP